jgi:hydroxymethylpyrimidine/phosphomethylpyrimidine kinase
LTTCVLSIAGSDGSGGAGIQADLKTIEAAGMHAATVVTAVTAQSTRGVLRVFVLPADVVRQQLDAVLSDLRIGAIKSGMLGDADVVRAVAAGLRAAARRPYVLDPVLAASDGTPLLAADALGVLASELFPLATLVTPNAPEASRLSGVEVRTLADAERAGRRLLSGGSGPAAVLVTGGHLEDARGTDLLVTAQESIPFPGEWIDTPHTHGTGCVLSAAIAARLAAGMPLADAVGAARGFVSAAVRHGRRIGAGSGPVDPLHGLRAASPPEVAAP